ncbi:MAG: hypothetical protein IH612_14500, partial [Desulfofustis sp.]|nr:hypothetical protein [Desulfofustis sp.]
MGLDYSYLLYFKRDQLWDVLQGIVEIAEPHHPPVSIHFPDHVLSIPLDSWSLKDKMIHHDDLEFGFDTVLKFKMDEAIIDYMVRHKLEEEEGFRGPPDDDEENLIAIGYIYLSVYQKIPDQSPSDLVLFDFGTTGTRMSMLFNYSMSIRETFLGLLK